MTAQEKKSLSFDANAGVKVSLTYVDGTKISYTAYEGLFYVTNVEEAYQTMNVCVPDGATLQVVRRKPSSGCLRTERFG